jgi:hypothetical protein
MLGRSIANLPIPTIVGQETSVHFMVADASEEENYRIGYEILDSASVRELVKPIEGGEITHPSELIRMMKWAYK